MGFSHVLIGSVLFTVILKVEGQTGTLTISADRPCVGGNLTLTCIQNGTFPGGAGFFVVFHKNQDETRAACSVDTRTSCSSTFPSGSDCGCISSNGDERVYKYIVSPASKNEEINWRCTRTVIPSTDTVRSDDIIPDIAEGATITNGRLSLVQSGSSLVCSGPTTIGDTTLVIANDTGVVLGNASSTTLTVPLPNITGADSVTFTCSLGGRGSRCNSVTPGVLVVSARTVVRCKRNDTAYAQNGTDVSISVKVSPPSSVEWSLSGTSKIEYEGVDTATATLTLKANKDNGITQNIQARAGNSITTCTLCVDDYPPSLPHGLTIGLALSSCGTVIILIIFGIHIKKVTEEGEEKNPKEPAANAKAKEGEEKEEEEEEEEPREPAANAKGSQPGIVIMILTIVFIVLTFALLVTVAILFLRHSESLTQAFQPAFIAGWFFFALGLLCVVVAVPLGIVRLVSIRKRKHLSKKQSHGKGKESKPDNGRGIHLQEKRISPDDANSAQTPPMPSPGRRLSPLPQGYTETNAENGQLQRDKKKKKKKSKKEKVNENKIRPLPQPNLGQEPYEYENQLQASVDKTVNTL